MTSDLLRACSHLTLGHIGKGWGRGWAPGIPTSGGSYATEGGSGAFLGMSGLGEPPLLGCTRASHGWYSKLSSVCVSWEPTVLPSASMNPIALPTSYERNHNNICPFVSGLFH